MLRLRNMYRKKVMRTGITGCVDLPLSNARLVYNATVLKNASIKHHFGKNVS
jgi:hypothetical protein